MKFEIINPSDEAYIEADKFEVACVATCIFSNGQYALKQVDGDLEMGLFIMGISPDPWFEKTFGTNFKDTADKIPPSEIKKALLSVHLAGERSSMNDFVKVAHNMANRMKD